MATSDRTDGQQLALPFLLSSPPTCVHDATAPLEPRQIPHPVSRATIKDWPRADRPREKLLDRGPAVLSNAELLAILLRNGPRGGTALDQARALLTRAGDDWRAVAQYGPSELRDLGLGDPKIAQVLAALEVAKRYGEREFKPGEPLRGSGDIYAHFRERLADEMCELFYAVLLDNKHRKLRDVMVSKGSLTASIVHPRLCAAAHKRGYVADRLMWCRAGCASPTKLPEQNDTT